MVQNIKNGIAAQGYDTVAFFTNKAVKGKSTISETYQEGKYFFKNEENRQKFLKDPNKYAPQYGGFCSIAMSEGAQADPNPKSFRIQEGKLYFFTRMFMGIIDAQRQWAKDPNGKKELADKAYAKMNE